MTMTSVLRKRALILTPLVLALAACSVGPDYVRPQTAAVPTAFKEMKDWKPAQPNELAMNGKWWEMFGDQQLNALVEQIDISNQNLAQSEANFRKAMALVQGARADYSPTLSVDASRTRSRSATSSSGNSSSSSVRDNYSFSLNADWEIDVWGRVRRNVESNEASAQASAADLAATRLSAQAQLAQNYLQLRVLDAQQQLLDDTVAAYQRSYQLTLNQYNAGVVAKSDVIQAQTQLKSAQAQALDNGVQRAQLEHAIALLVGQPASTFSITPSPLAAAAPPIPVALPSMLLERRPDIAGAERRVAAANAQIGVAQAAYYPSLSLSASGGFQTSNGLANWFTMPSRVWSLGPQLSQLIFDGGARRSVTDQAIATYDGVAAAYRQTVLTAFQEVEDNLAALRILEQEAVVQNEALQSARQAVTLVTNQYKSGVVNYTSVITAQATALTSERTALDILYRRMAASVLLTKALGGGWSEQNIADLGALASQSENSKKK
ncbi:MULTISPECIES: efflux transporter outer membrane subunit [unclassified Herbaspirillum]|uniref:efflux transporter outer membrane subunit n=1 Tax=unclassified Herbaspirillum TaxID=2624150 RepID=UPI000E2FDAFE|nr:MULTISPECIES: efflux transporter outer membrane subunit [unclassified Herbaspirillum]RFB68558.1 RND transporter [Herbaspirillum sp. 3R-3a1]TFI05459.1 efflux transporter outer membrane subunit [Herbaspirillum sp. 3R11]TFI13630.1 efflux transporter outer membrane subunit [Herbaspirillum sp. 3R-11]TFI20607.1 efflux transporter outer membrane subunit [Herbaspirillum sp. 3C11]